MFGNSFTCTFDHIRERREVEAEQKVRKAASRVAPVARGKTQRRDREVLFYSDLRGFLPSPRTFTLRDRILRIRAAALFLPVLYAVIDPTYAVEAIPGEYSVRRNLWMYLEDAAPAVTEVSPRPFPSISHITWSYGALLPATRPANRVFGIRRRQVFIARRQFDIVRVS